MPSKPLNVLQFFKEFPDDDTCLEHLFQTRYGSPLDCPKCGKNSTFHRVKARPVYACQWCGHQISPMAGTPFERSSTALQKWFYAMYLFTTSRHGVPAKELQRQLSVTYKTAWRMGHEIRKYMAQVDGDDSEMGPHVELDETFIGGHKKRKGPGGDPARDKAIVFGIHERGGDVQTYVVPSRKHAVLKPLIAKHVPPGTTVSTDEAVYYTHLRETHKHGVVRHENEEWARGIHHVNSIEGFWSRVKNSIRGTHIHVSKKHLPKYLGEFEFRWNMRGVKASLMFDRLLQAF